MISVLKTRIKGSTVIRSLKILPKSDRPKIFAAIAMQVSLGFLDLIGKLQLALTQQVLQLSNH